MIDLFIGLHVALGTVAVLGMVIAWSTKKGGLWHRRAGKAYVYGMAAAIAVSFVVSLATQNVFLFLIGLFSGYLVYTGYRSAAARNSVRSSVDQGITIFVLLIALSMFVYAVFNIRSDVSIAVILAVFGAILFSLAFSDYRRGDYWPKGKERILLHLSRMGGANIATITAVFVVNVQTSPAFIAWLAPSLIGGFLINYHTRALNASRPA